jgi:integrase/recombinase XerC
MKPPRTPGDPRGMEIIDEYLEHLRRAGRTEATIHGRREILTRHDAALAYGVGQTDDTELAAWLYRDEWARNTRYTYYMALKSFYGWATNPADPWLSYDPTTTLEPVTMVRGVPRPVTDEQLRRILTEAAEPVRTWALIAAYQGLRCIEIARLDREHVTEQTLIVVKGKGGRPRVHDTHPDVWARVQQLPPGPVAVRADGRRADAFYVSSTAALHFRRRLHMPGVNLHRLRHWLGVSIQRAYRDIRVTQQTLGHQSLQSTQVYTDATPEQQRAARAMLPRLADG